MRRTLTVFALLLVLAGCSSPSGRGSRLLPWNWFSPDHATQLAAAQANTAAATAPVEKKAQENVRAAGKTIRLLPEGLLKQVLQEFNDRADAELADALGVVTPEVDRGLTLLVQQLTSENLDLRKDGAAALAKRDKVEDALGEELTASRGREADLTTKLQQSDLKYQAEAESSRRTKFIIYGLIAVWLLGNMVLKLAQANPAFAGMAKAFSVVATPVLAAAKARAEEGLQKVGHGMATLRDKLPGLLAEVKDLPNAAKSLEERVTGIFDAHTDADTQKAIATAANTAPRT